MRSIEDKDGCKSKDNCEGDGPSCCNDMMRVPPPSTWRWLLLRLQAAVALIRARMYARCSLQSWTSRASPNAAKRAVLEAIGSPGPDVLYSLVALSMWGWSVERGPARSAFCKWRWKSVANAVVLEVVVGGGMDQGSGKHGSSNQRNGLESEAAVQGTEVE